NYNHDTFPFYITVKALESSLKANKYNPNAMSTPGVLKIKQRGKPSTAVSATPPNTPSVAGSVSSTANLSPPRLKAVIRRLPASMTPEEFHILCGDVLNNESFEWFEFIPGKVPEE